MTTKIRQGRPPAGEEAPTMTTIHVRLDAATLALLEKLEKAQVGALTGARSMAVRRAIHEAAARLK